MSKSKLPDLEPPFWRKWVAAIANLLPIGVWGVFVYLTRGTSNEELFSFHTTKAAWISGALLVNIFVSVLIGTGMNFVFLPLLIILASAFWGIMTLSWIILYSLEFDMYWLFFLVPAFSIFGVLVLIPFKDGRFFFPLEKEKSSIIEKGIPQRLRIAGIVIFGVVTVFSFQAVLTNLPSAETAIDVGNGADAYDDIPFTLSLMIMGLASFLGIVMSLGGLLFYAEKNKYFSDRFERWFGGTKKFYSESHLWMAFTREISLMKSGENAAALNKLREWKQMIPRNNIIIPAEDAWLKRKLREELSRNLHLMKSQLFISHPEIASLACKKCHCRAIVQEEHGYKVPVCRKCRQGTHLASGVEDITAVLGKKDLVGTLTRWRVNAWDEKGVCARDIDFDVLEIHPSDGINLDWAIADLLEHYQPVNDSKRLRVIIFGDPVISENTRRVLDRMAENEIRE